MGFFSWKTADTKESIPNRYSGREPFTVYMTSPDGRQWEEAYYEGYGSFGGKDIFELIAELNGKSHRNDGIDLLYSNSDSDGTFSEAAKNGLILPTLTKEKLDKFKPIYPQRCKQQGYFY